MKYLTALCIIVMMEITIPSHALTPMVHNEPAEKVLVSELLKDNDEVTYSVSVNDEVSFMIENGEIPLFTYRSVIPRHENKLNVLTFVLEKTSETSVSIGVYMNGRRVFTVIAEEDIASITVCDPIDVSISNMKQNIAVL